MAEGAGEQLHHRRATHALNDLALMQTPVTPEHSASIEENLTRAAPAWVRSLAARGLRERGFAAQEATLQVTGRREWRNSTIYLCRAEGGPTVVIKEGKGWTVPITEHLYTDARRLKRLVDEAPAGSVDLVLFDALAFSDAPPALCMSFVPGHDGTPYLAARMARPTPQHVQELEAAVEGFGRALASFHRLEASALVPGDLDDGERAVRRISRYLGLSGKLAQRDPKQLVMSRSFDDPGLHNLRLTDEGRCCLLDLPHERRIMPVHADVAATLAWLDDAYRDAPLLERPSLRRHLGAALLSGYAAVGLVDVRTADQQWWLRFFRTWSQLNWVRTAYRRRHRAQALTNLLWSAQGQIELRRNRR